METATDVSQVTLFFFSHRNKNSLIMNIELSLGQESIRTLCIDSLVPSSRGPPDVFRCDPHFTDEAAEALSDPHVTPPLGLVW